MNSRFVFVLVSFFITSCCCQQKDAPQDPNESQQQQQQTTNGYRVMKKIIDQCSQKDDVMKCFKIHALKIADRALHSHSFGLIDGVSVVRSAKATARSFKERIPYNEEKLEQLQSDQIDDLLADTASRFVETHTIQLNVPRLIEEGRGKMKKYMGPFLAALAIKGSFLAMAYKGIAVMAGTALLVGKMALILSAILGLKKLVSSGHEKTTFEIVKHPQHTQSHTYSSSYEDEGHYHRSLSTDEDMLMQARAYRGHKRP